MEIAQSLVLFICFILVLFSIGLIILMILIQTSSLKELDIYENEFDELTKEKS